MSIATRTQHICGCENAGLVNAKSSGSPAVVRIALLDHKASPAVDLSEFSKLPGYIDTWFAVAPDGSIIFLRNIKSNDIYALHFALR